MSAEGRLFFLFLVLLCVLDDLLGNVGGNILVADELTAEGTAALSHAAEIGSILEHFAEGSFCDDFGSLGSGVGTDKTTAAAAHIAHDIAHVIVGNENLIAIDRLNEDGVSLGAGCLVGKPCSGFECNFLGVNGMIFAVVEGSLDAHHGVACKNTLVHCFAETLLDCGDEFLGR